MQPLGSSATGRRIGRFSFTRGRGRVAADMKAKIYILPRKAVRHPPSEAILDTLRQHFGLSNATALSLGKFYEIEFADGDADRVKKQAEEFAYREANSVMEDYRVEIEP